MNAIIARPAAGATRAPSSKNRAADPAPGQSPKVKPARPTLSEGDYCAMAVGTQIYHLLAPVVEGPFDTKILPAFDLLYEANNFAWDLHKIEEEWQEDGAPPTVAQLISGIHASLHSAMIELMAAPVNELGALLYCTRLLVREALNIATSLQQAYAGLPDTAPALSELISFQKPIAELEGLPEKGTITANTPSHRAGEFGDRLLINACYEIEQIADEVTLLGDEAAVSSEFKMAALLRCYGTRVKNLNGLLMGHLDRDGESLARVQSALYAGAKTLPMGALA